RLPLRRGQAGLQGGHRVEAEDRDKVIRRRTGRARDRPRTDLEGAQARDALHVGEVSRLVVRVERGGIGGRAIEHHELRHGSLPEGAGREGAVAGWRRLVTTLRLRNAQRNFIAAVRHHYGFATLVLEQLARVQNPSPSQGPSTVAM